MGTIKQHLKLILRQVNSPKVCNEQVKQNDI